MHLLAATGDSDPATAIALSVVSLLVLVVVRFGEELMDHVIRPARDAGLLQDAVRPEVLVEWVYRLLLSFLTLPSNWVRTDAQLRATLHALLVPVLLK